MNSSKLRAAWVGPCLAVFLFLGVGGCGNSEDSSKSPPPPPRVPGQPDVGFVATPDPIVEKMLELAEIRPDDVVYDLGCGDGRIVIAAARKYGVKAVGIEIDPSLADQARANAKSQDVEHLVTIRQGDIFEEDFQDATVITMYLLPDLNVKLMPKLKTLPKGTRIVSHSFPMKGARPEKIVTVAGKKVYFWRIPWRSE